MIPLLKNPDTVLESKVTGEKPAFFTSPVVVFSLFLIIIIIASALVRNKNRTGCLTLFSFRFLSSSPPYDIL